MERYAKTQSWRPSSGNGLHNQLMKVRISSQEQKII